MPDGDMTPDQPTEPWTDPVVPATAAPAAPRPPMTAADRVRMGLRGIGQTLITCGVVVLLFVVYQVWITNIFAHQKQVKVHNQFESALDVGVDPLGLPGADQSGIPLGTGIANIYIPRLGRDYAFTVVQGTDDASLEKGPGHYVGTALPGQVGNFAIAGHRVGKGEPFLNLDHLRSGDAVIIETAKAWYVYRIIGNKAKGVPGLGLPYADKYGVPGREIVNPSDGRVLLPVPNCRDGQQLGPGYAQKCPPTGPGARDRYITMTTCHPKFTAAQRMILHGQLQASLDKVAKGKNPNTGATIYVNTMPDLIKALYNEDGL